MGILLEVLVAKELAIVWLLLKKGWASCDLSTGSKAVTEEAGV